MHFGVGFEFSPVQDIIAAAQLAEDNGFESCWIAEDYYFRGAFSIASAIAARTRSLRIGTGVVNPYTRHPVLTAMEMLALDEISCGRAFLGLGASERFWMEAQLHIAYGSPRTALRESIEIMRGLWQGGSFSYQGTAFQVSDVSLALPPLRSRIPIYLGVVRQHNLALAGEVGDGALLPLMAHPAYVRFAMDHVRRGLAKAGKSLSDFPVYCYVLVSIDQDRGTARQRVKPILGKVLGYLKDHPVLACSGHADEEIQPFVEGMRSRTDCAGMVADWMIDTFAIAGTGDECVDKVAGLAQCGVTGLIVFECAGIPFRETVEACSRYLMPAFV